MGRPSSRDGWLLALLAVAFVGSRLAWLAWRPESAVYWEESYRWMAAHELLAGPVQPLLEYQADHYQGGSLAVVLLVLPFFAGLGESLLSFKLAAVLLSTGTLVALFWVARGAFGCAAAGLAGLAYLAGPPLVAYWGLVPFGSHGESALFSLLALAVFYGLLGAAWHGPRAWLAFGLVAGLGCWWSPTTALTLLACAASWLLLRPLPRPGEILAAAAGGCLGLAPWIAYNAAHDFAGVVRILDLFGMGDPINLWPAQSLPEKLARLVVKDFPLGLAAPFQSAAPGPTAGLRAAALAFPLYAALGVGFARAARLLRDRLAGREPDPASERLLFFPLYALFFLAGFLGSAYTVEPEQGAVTYRFFVPLGVLAVLLGAALAGEALPRGGWRRGAALSLCASYFAAATVGTLLLAARPLEADAAAGLEQGYLVRGLLLHRKYEGDLGRALAVAARVGPEKENSLILVGIGWGLLYRFEKSGSPEALRAALRAMGPRERARVLSGIHTSLAIRTGQIEERLARGVARDEERGVYERLELLRALADEESRAIPTHAWPAGGYATPEAEAERAAAPPAKRGQAFYHLLGCAGCHDAAPGPGPAVWPLGGLAERHSLDSLAAILAAPPDPMPPVDLPEAGRRELAAYLLETFP